MALPDKPLFAIACLVWKPSKGIWDSAMEYVHADSREQAKAFFMAANPNRKYCRFIECAQAIGWFVEKYDGNREWLSAD